MGSCGPDHGFSPRTRRKKPNRKLWIRASLTESKGFSVTRRQHHNRIRTGRVGAGHECTAAHAGASRKAGKTKRTSDPDASGPDSSVSDPSGFETPPLDVKTAASENAVWVHLRGEADLGNHQQLRSELSGVELDGADAVHLVLDDLTFCDLCAFRHLVAFAAQVRAAGRRLSAHGACPSIQKIARLLNVSHELHFV